MHSSGCFLGHCRPEPGFRFFASCPSCRLILRAPFDSLQVADTLLNFLEVGPIQPDLLSGALRAQILTDILRNVVLAGLIESILCAVLSGDLLSHFLLPALHLCHSSRGVCLGCGWR